MSTEIAINTTNLPATFLNPNAAQANSGLMSGISLGAPPTLGLKGTRFVLKTDGAEQVLDSLAIEVIILDGRPGLSKAWYATKYDPNKDEGKVPDCFSNLGEKPEPGCALKQSEFCATCPQNQFGTGTAADGSPSKGKACADNKIMAVFYQGQIYQMKVPPMSLRALGEYVNQLVRHQLDCYKVRTKISFNPKFDFAVLTFEYNGIIPVQALPQVEEFRASHEVQEILNPRAYTVAQAAQATPQIPAPAAPQEMSNQELASLGLPAGGVAAAPAAAPAPAKETKAKAAKPAVVPPPVAEAPAQQAAAEAVVIPVQATSVVDDEDAAAAASLGLKF